MCEAEAQQDSKRQPGSDDGRAAVATLVAWVAEGSECKPTEKEDENDCEGACGDGLQRVEECTRNRINGSEVVL